jgi:hypothetical protein
VSLVAVTLLLFGVTANAGIGGGAIVVLPKVSGSMGWGRSFAVRRHVNG